MNTISSFKSHIIKKAKKGKAVHFAMELGFFAHWSNLNPVFPGAKLIINYFERR